MATRRSAQVTQTGDANTWPIGIRLFNRPEHAERLLNSLKLQTKDLSATPIFVRIDGYQGSLDQEAGRPDRTAEVSNLVKSYFPHALVNQYEQNHGIAEVNFALQDDAYSDTSAEWSLFFEEDIVLQATYIEALHHMIALAQDVEEVVKVAIGQLNLGYIRVPVDKKRSQFYLAQGTKAFAERRSFFLERKNLTEIYLRTIAGRQYSSRDESEVFAALAESGIFTIMGNNDVVHDRITAAMKRLHITSPESLFTDVGVEGETNFVHPEIVVPDLKTANVLHRTQEDLRRALPLLQAEAHAFEYRFFKDFWGGYMVSKSGRLAFGVLAKKAAHFFRR
jgi:hypothetical protein